jgi:hypothetical protein
MAVATIASTVSPLGAGGGAGSDGRSLVAILLAAADLASPSSSVAGAIPSQLLLVPQQKEMGDGADNHDGSIRSVSDGLVGRGRERGPVARARIEDNPAPSIDLTAARAMKTKPEKERRQRAAREWFAKGVAAMTGTGKLHWA